jgi:hypothetical protein
VRAPLSQVLTGGSLLAGRGQFSFMGQSFRTVAGLVAVITAVASRRNRGRGSGCTPRFVMHGLAGEIEMAEARSEPRSSSASPLSGRSGCLRFQRHRTRRKFRRRGGQLFKLRAAASRNLKSRDRCSGALLRGQRVANTP